MSFNEFHILTNETFTQQSPNFWLLQTAAFINSVSITQLKEIKESQSFLTKMVVNIRLHYCLLPLAFFPYKQSYVHIKERYCYM